MTEKSYGGFTVWRAQDGGYIVTAPAPPRSGISAPRVLFTSTALGEALRYISRQMGEELV